MAGERSRFTSAEVRTVCFHTTWLRPGYREDEVDTFLDQIAATLDHQARADTTAAPLTPDEIAHHSLSATAFLRVGYNAAEVDTFLLRVAYTLRDAEESSSSVEAEDPVQREDPAEPSAPTPPVTEISKPDQSTTRPSFVAPEEDNPTAAETGDQQPETAVAPLGAAEVRGVMFRTNHVRPGYAEGAVDALLERVERTLDAMDGPVSQVSPEEPITATEVQSAEFPVLRFGASYHPSDVDDFLDRVVTELRRRGLN